MKPNFSSKQSNLVPPKNINFCGNCFPKLNFHGIKKTKQANQQETSDLSNQQKSCKRKISSSCRK